MAAKKTAKKAAAKKTTSAKKTATSKVCLGCGAPGKNSRTCKKAGSSSANAH